MMIEPISQPFTKITPSIPIPDKAPIITLVFYLCLEYQNSEDRKEQLRELFYRSKAPQFWDELLITIQSDEATRKWYEYSLEAVKNGDIEEYLTEPNYDPFQDVETGLPQVYTVSFILSVEKQGYPIPKAILDELQLLISNYHYSKLSRDRQKIEFPPIESSEFIKRLDEPLWQMTDALIYICGFKCKGNHAAKLSFIRYNKLTKMIRGYAEDAHRTGDLELFDYTIDAAETAEKDNKDRQEIAFLNCKIRPKLFVVWLNSLPLNIPIISRHVKSIGSPSNRTERIIIRSHPGLEELLHPVIAERAYTQFVDGHLRDSVLNSIIALFDYLREKTALAEDGTELVGKSFSLSDPHVVMSEVVTESGRSDQKGFLQIFQGAYIGIRNPKAHSLTHSLTETKAVQYLIFASLLARRLDEAKYPKRDT